MGLFKALYLAKQILPDADREIAILEKEWAKSSKKFRKHVDGCLKLRNWPNEQCDECTRVAVETGKMGWLWGIREEFRRLNTPSIQDLYSNEQIIEAALNEWSSDPSRSPAGGGTLVDKYHDSVSVVIFDVHEGPSPGSVKVTHNPNGLQCEPRLRTEIPWDAL